MNAVRYPSVLNKLLEEISSEPKPEFPLLFAWGPVKFPRDEWSIGAEWIRLPPPSEYANDAEDSFLLPLAREFIRTQFVVGENRVAVLRSEKDLYRLTEVCDVHVLFFQDQEEVFTFMYVLSMDPSVIGVVCIGVVPRAYEAHFPELAMPESWPSVAIFHSYEGPIQDVDEGQSEAKESCEEISFDLKSLFVKQENDEAITLGALSAYVAKHMQSLPEYAMAIPLTFTNMKQKCLTNTICLFFFMDRYDELEVIQYFVHEVQYHNPDIAFGFLWTLDEAHEFGYNVSLESSDFTDNPEAWETPLIVLYASSLKYKTVPRWLEDYEATLHTLNNYFDSVAERGSMEREHIEEL